MPIANHAVVRHDVHLIVRKNHSEEHVMLASVPAVGEVGAGRGRAAVMPVRDVERLDVVGEARG